MLLRPYMLQPAALRASHVYRPRLMEQLRQCVTKTRVVLIRAPAGHGKSLALAEFLETERVPWIYLPGERLKTSAPAAILANILTAINLRLGISPAVQRLPASGTTAGAEQSEDVSLFTALIDRLYSLGEPLLLVIEDHHDLSGDARLWIQRLINEAPDKLSFLISTRFRPEWPISWFASGLVSQIMREQLLFQPADCLELARNMHINLSEDEAQTIFTYAGGWPIFYGLVFHHMHNVGSEHTLDQLRKLNRPEREIFDYIASAFLRSLPADAQALLCKTAVLSHIDEQLCAEIFGIPDARPLLAQFESCGFLSRVNEQERPCYAHSHALLRDFLAQQLRLRPGDDEQSLYHLAGEFYERRAEIEEALRFYCQSGDIDRAARIVVTNGLSLVLTGKFLQLQGWLAILPGRIVENTPELLIYKGIAQLELGGAEADVALNKARMHFEACADLPNITWIKAELAWLYHLRGQNELATKMVPWLIDHQLSLDPLRRGRSLSIIGMVYLGNGDLALAEHYLQHAIELYRTLAALECQKALPRMLHFLGRTFVTRGHFQQAERAFQEGYQLACRLKLAPDALGCLKYQQALVYHHTGQFQESLEALDIVERHIQDATLDYQQEEHYLQARMRRGHIHRDMGDPHTARSYYAQASLDGSAIELALNLTLRDHCDKALAPALEYYHRSRHWQSPLEMAKAEAILGIAYLSHAEHHGAFAQEHFAAAKRHLEAALPEVERSSSTYFLATYRLYLANLYVMIGRTYDAWKSLEYTLSEMKRSRCYNLDIWQPWVVARMCAHAIRESIEPDFAVELAARRLSLNYGAEFIPLLNHEDQIVRSRASHMLQALRREPFFAAAKQTQQSQAYQQAQRHGMAALLSRFPTEHGLVYLDHYRIIWSEIDILAPWIRPAFRPASQLAETAGVAPRESPTRRTRPAASLRSFGRQRRFQKRKRTNKLISKREPPSSRNLVLANDPINLQS
jgi:tetratricopeptide (TPR) repeat protein